MESKRLNNIFFFGLFFGVSIGVIVLMWSFFSAMLIAAILALLFRPAYTWLLKKTGQSSSLSAFLTCLFILSVIIVPLFIALGLVVSEANTLYQSVAEEKTMTSVLQTLSYQVGHIPIVGTWIGEDALNSKTLSSTFGSFGQNAISLLQAAYQGIVHFFFWVFVMFFALYYFLIDGRRAIQYIVRLSPLRDQHDQLLINRFISISRATIKGTFLVGVVQGILGGLMFWAAGVPSPFLWGSVMIVFSIIPVVGAGIVWVPAALVMLLLGDIWQGLFIIGVGTGIISTIDNILRPKLVGKDTHMHPLLVFFATLGGISLFGLLGFIIGPVIVALFLALSEIYMIEFGRQATKYNEAHTGA